MIATLTLNKEAILHGLNKGYGVATDFADYLVKKGLSFRDAHKKSAKLVNIAEKKNMALDQLNFKVIKKIDPLIQKDVLKILKIENSINSKKSYGGTSLQNVVKMLKKLKKEFK